MGKHPAKSQEKLDYMKKNHGERESKLNIRRKTQQKVKKSLMIWRKAMVNGRIGWTYEGKPNKTQRKTRKYEQEPWWKEEQVERVPCTLLL